MPLQPPTLTITLSYRPRPKAQRLKTYPCTSNCCELGKILMRIIFEKLIKETPDADVLYDLGTGLEVLSPLCPHLFLEMAGLGNFAKEFEALVNID
nr:Protein root UVB sensitive 2 chloroplastic [Ipomoea trifida]